MKIKDLDLSMMLKTICRSQSDLLRRIATSLLMIFMWAPISFAQKVTIPTPESVFGFEIGTDFKLANYEQSLDYFHQLAAASDLVTLKYLGETSEGRPWYYAIITSKENSEHIERYKEISQLLAHPGELTVAQAKALSKEGKPIVHIDGGLHATEVAGAQHTISLAHYLISHAEDEKVKRILDDVVLLLWP